MSLLLKLLAKHSAAVGVAAVASTASLLFGFDTGVAGSVVALKSFSSQFNFSTNPARAADISSNIVALLNAGAFFGALAPAVSSRYMGRKITMSFAACFLLLGGILQTAAQPPHLSMIYGGRVISGFGVGIVSNFTPLYVAETSPKELRGFLMSLFEMFLVSGGLLAYWTTYGCSLHLAPTSKQWRIPLSIQIVLAAIVLGGSLFIVESPRWLAKQGRWDEARDTLAYLRGVPSDGTDLKSELAEMHAQIDEEIRSTAGRSFKELLQRKNLIRLLWGCGIAFFGILCGSNAILYYAPTVFKQIGFTNQNSALFASGMFTVIKVVVTVIFLALGIQNFGRRGLLSIGSFSMMAMLFSLGAILKYHPPIAGKSSNNTPSGRAMYVKNGPILALFLIADHLAKLSEMSSDVVVKDNRVSALRICFRLSYQSVELMATIYLYIIAYSMSWGPLIWVYMGEIFPTRIRDYSMAIATMIVWCFNFVISKWTPAMVLHIGWKTWIFFGIMNAVAFIFTLFLPETKSLSLEEMDVLFHVVDERTRRLNIEEYFTTSQPGAHKSAS